MAAFTTIALGVGVATSLAGTAMSLSSAAQQSKAQSAAEQAAGEFASKAEAEYQREFAGGVQLPMEAYQQAGREGTAQQMQALQALQEADSRSLAAGVGKVQAAATEAQAGITEQMRQDLFSLESAQMEEKMANRDQIAKMNQERAIGAQKAAANAQAAKTAAIGSALSGVSSAVGQVAQASSLYPKTGATVTDTSIAGQPGNASGFGGVNYSSSSFGSPGTIPTSSVSTPATFGPMNNPNMVSAVTSPRKTLSQLKNDQKSWANDYNTNLWLEQQQNKVY
jgi:hypothetical protein